VNAAQLLLCMTLAGSARNPPNSSLELVQRTAPPPTSPPCILSQCCSGFRLPDTFDRSIPSNRYVPSSPFLTTSTVCSARSFAGLLHPAASHGVRPVSHHPFPFEQLAEANPQLPRARIPAEAILLTLERYPPQFQSTVRRRFSAPMETRRNEPMIIPSGASTLRSFPLHLSRTIVTTGSPCFHAAPVPPSGHPLTLLLSAPFFQFPPQPLPVLASPGLLVTSLNLRVLSRDAVRCTDMPLPTCPYPLLPWAFRTSVHRCPGIMRSNPMSISDRNPAGRSNNIHSIAARKQPWNFIRSHVLQAPRHLPQPKLHQLSKSLASGLRSPVNFPQP